jgi:hypothetical protein
MEFMIPIVMFICIAGVAVLRPITKPLGRYLDSLARERMGAGERGLRDRGLERVTDLLDRLNTRIDMLEERMQFAERLADGSRRGSIARLAE